MNDLLTPYHATELVAELERGIARRADLAASPAQGPDATAAAPDLALGAPGVPEPPD